jgi:signal peptidase I
MSEVGSVAAETVAALKCDLASEVLRSFGNLRFTATGWSMLPTVWPGDTLVVERVDPNQVHVGNVVLVGREGRLCAHRVISRAEGSGDASWITQGDAMSAPDRPVIEDELLGRVSYLIRVGRLVAVPAKLSVIERLTARIVRRSVPAARALVYLHHMVHIPEKLVSSKSASEKSDLPCPR